MKKVLIITYYWPPSGGGGVQRWLKFTKYLRTFGWEPIIYTPKNPESPANDNSLFKDVPDNLTVLKRSIWEPYNIYKKFIGQKKEEKIGAAFLTENKKPKLAENISVWIRGNLFIPDARKFWIKSSVRYLTKYINKNPVDVIVSTGPPHSTHIIGLKLNKKNGIPWLADFRDQWTKIGFYDKLRLGSWADKKHHRLELKVLKRASSIMTVSQDLAKNFNLIYNRDYSIVTNGYDTDDMESSEIIPDKKFSIAHIGTLFKERNFSFFWKTLEMLVNTNQDFRNDLEIKLVGKVDISVLETIEQHNLDKLVKKIEYLPHSEVIKIQRQSQVLLLLIDNTSDANGMLTGKLFEYLAAKRPILCIGPTDGDSAKVIKQTKAGSVIDFNDEKKLKENILYYYQLFKKGELISKNTGIEKYSRKNLTKELADILNNMLS